MDYPYKYLVVITDSDDYSESESIHKCVDLDDALNKINVAKEFNLKCAMYRINQHHGYK